VDPTHELASWSRRLAAMLVDGIILSVIVLATIVSAGVPLEDVNTTILEGSSLALLLIFILPKAIYDTADDRFAPDLREDGAAHQGRRRGRPA
jgi:uncharacterized RDD family membrane protein YckC